MIWVMVVPWFHESTGQNFRRFAQRVWSIYVLLRTRAEANLSKVAHQVNRKAGFFQLAPRGDAIFPTNIPGWRCDWSFCTMGGSNVGGVGNWIGDGMGSGPGCKEGDGKVIRFGNRRAWGGVGWVWGCRGSAAQRCRFGWGWSGDGGGLRRRVNVWKVEVEWVEEAH